MKFLIIDAYYPRFLRAFHKSHRDLAKLSYDKQLKALLGQCFGTSDYYSYNLRKLGHVANDIVVNGEIIQRRWADEHNVEVPGSLLWSKIQSLPLMHRILGRPRWMQEIVSAQIQHYRPDVLYIQDLSMLNPDTLLKAKAYCRLVVGQTAAPLPPYKFYKNYDLIITSFPHYVKKFLARGIASEYLKISFEPRVLKRIGARERKYDVSFVGSFSPYHATGTKLLEKVAAKIAISIWGHGIHFVSQRSPLRRYYHGEAWGLKMYEVLAQSKIVINRHISVAGKFANNMRLYESTGMGAMLITDDKINLKNLFLPGKEIVVYSNGQELIKLVKYYLANDSEREKIAKAGQRRTIVEHTYRKRMVELIKIVKKYLNTHGKT